MRVKLSKQIKKLEHYDVHDRTHAVKIGAVVLAVATVMSVVAEHHDAHKRIAKGDVMANSEISILKSEVPEKNEMVRMPIKFDDGLRAATTTGA